jgi:hypothetical protein
LVWGFAKQVLYCPVLQTRRRIRWTFFVNNYARSASNTSKSAK